MGFHGSAAACKPHSAKYNAKGWMEWCKAHSHWTLEQWKHVQASLFGGLMGESGFGGCQENVTCLTALFMVWRDCFSGARIGPLLPVKGILSASAYQVILEDLVKTVFYQDCPSAQSKQCP